MRLRDIVIQAYCLVLAGSLAGCFSTGTVAPATDASGNKKDRKASSEDLLKSAISQLRPENYTISAAQDKPVALLNSWSALLAEESPQKRASQEATPVPPGWIEEQDAVRKKQEQFDLRDAVHIRDAMLTHTIANYLSVRGRTELQRVNVVFDFVVRNIALRGPSDPDLPIAVFHLLLTGRGSAEDRAWVCWSLLKQLRLDSVIVQTSDRLDDPETWLFGVVLNDRLYLYDLRLGIPIPSTDDVSKPSETPATLDEIARHPEWLQRLAARADQSYSIEADALTHARILPIVEPNFWFQRMKILEEALPANHLCVLFDPLIDENGRTGLWNRIAKAIPDWKGEQAQPWLYPRRQNAVTSPEMRQLFEFLLGPFELPIPVEKSEDGRILGLGKPERKMLRIRLDQLLGNFEEATKRYFSIRHLEIDPDQLQIPKLPALNQIAAEDAIYWTAVCKFESREYESAIEQLNGYLKRFERNGRWNFAARALLGNCYAELGQYSAAAAALERSTRSDDPYRLSNSFHIKQWNARATKTSAETK